MRAVVCPTLGGPDVLELREVASPEMAAGEVLVRVEAASVNFPDVLLTAGRYQLRVDPPFVPGSEFAGVVVEVSSAVTGVSAGDRVFGSSLIGAFAELIAVSATSLTPVPEGVDARHAAAFGVAHRTAYHVLRSVAGIEAGEALIVLGAGGGVGLAAVQLGSALGADVTAVASTPEKLRVAEMHGASRSVNHKAGDLRQALKDVLPDGADVVVDPVGGSLSEPALRSLRWGGRFVTVGYAAGEIPRIPLNLVLLKGVHILGFEFLGFASHAPEETRRDDDEVLELLRSKRALPHIGASFPLDRAADALRLVAAGNSVGKVVLDIATAG